MNNNIDINRLMALLSKMDKSELEKGLNQAQSMLNVKNKDEIMKMINNLNNGK